MQSQRRLLLLHRVKEPNAGLYSPIGGKLDQSSGESPHACAVREIEEESGVRVDDRDVRLFGVMTERAYEGRSHWLIFMFEVARPIPANALIEGCAQALNNHDQPAQAVELAMFAEDLYPADPYAPLLLGQALERTGETQQARAAYRRALERLATDDDHHRAQALRGLERLQD